MTNHLTRKGLIVGLACAGMLAASVAPAAASRKSAAAPFSLETFFAGRTEARGRFESGIAGVERTFTVKTRGTWNGKLLVLIEDIFYDDGQKERKTWRITKLGPGQYVGERDDVVGTAAISQQGETISLDYTADVSGKDGSTTRVRFADTIVPAGPGGAHNTATVYKYFLPVGSVDITFRKLHR
ncbi:MAG: DUF3833 domain-containing protein [Beijerinckiaceae bacterium]|nr:DUF3833 domain-containing protein [Beijerinckiaceae bacterium]